LKQTTDTRSRGIDRRRSKEISVVSLRLIFAYLDRIPWCLKPIFLRLPWRRFFCDFAQDCFKDCGRNGLEQVLIETRRPASAKSSVLHRPLIAITRQGRWPASLRHPKSSRPSPSGKQISLNNRSNVSFSATVRSRASRIFCVTYTPCTRRSLTCLTIAGIETGHSHQDYLLASTVGTTETKRNKMRRKNVLLRFERSLSVGCRLGCPGP
jgi:hypothetical protein